MKTKSVILFLVLITLVSFGFKLLVSDFSIPVNSDNLDYTLFAIAHTNGDFSQSSHRGMGWSMFTSIFFGFIDSESLLDYSITIKTLSIVIGLSTIPVICLVGRKFFDERYSLFAASLFAFEPHLNYNSTLGLTEPIFILVVVGSFYFILNQNTRLFFISSILAGIAYWVRINGVWVIIAVSIIFSGGTITQRSTISKLLHANTTPTIFFPISCTSPFTVAINIFPFDFLPSTFSSSIKGTK